MTALNTMGMNALEKRHRQKIVAPRPQSITPLCMRVHPSVAGLRRGAGDKGRLQPARVAHSMAELGRWKTCMDMIGQCAGV